MHSWLIRVQTIVFLHSSMIEKGSKNWFCVETLYRKKNNGLTALPKLVWYINHISVSGITGSVIYTECPRRNGQNFGRVFLMLNYTDITQNTYIQSWTVMEIMVIEKCGLLGCPRTVRRPWRHTHPLRMPGNETPLANIVMQWPWRDNATAAACVKCLVTLRTTMTWVRVFL